MGDMIEKVARKLFDERNRIWLGAGGDPAHFVSWEAENEGFREQLRHEARVVIEAMREPTEDMKIIDGSNRWGWNCNTCGGPAENWQAMIDAALSEPK